MKQYRILLWDIDGTVLNFLAAEKAAIRALFVKYGLKTCTDEMIERYSRINVRYWQMLEAGKMSKPEILVGRFKEFFESEGIDGSIADAFNADYQLQLGETIVFCDHAGQLLYQLKKDFRLIAITNGTKQAQNKKLSRSGLIDLFDGIYISENVGYEKPRREFFDYVFEKENIVNKDEVLLIGDSLTSDIRGGNNAQVDTCWYNPRKESNDKGVHVDYEIAHLFSLNSILYPSGSKVRIRAFEKEFVFCRTQSGIAWYDLDHQFSCCEECTLELNADREVYGVFTDEAGNKHYGTIGDGENPTIADNYPCDDEPYVFHENPSAENFYV